LFPPLLYCFLLNEMTCSSPAFVQKKRIDWNLSISRKKPKEKKINLLPFYCC
jgi:hypothetical protein